MDVGEKYVRGPKEGEKEKSLNVYGIGMSK